MNKLAREGRSGGTHPATRSGKACKIVCVRKIPMEGVKGHFPHEL
jgi:hypothetical protein